MELIRKYPKTHYKRMIVSSLMCCIFLNALFSVALAGPEGAQVVNGQVTFQQSGYNTTITASDKAIINYSSFDITRPEVVQFIQPNSNASVLNRIQSENPTNINGTLLANGRVFFVNPAGVYIGASAKVNVNQLVASGLNITNSDFINGRFNFEGGNGSVINNGDITAEKVYLIGKQVANSGNISCPAGYVVMAAGDRVFLSEPDSEIMLEIDPQTLPEQTDPAESRPGVLNEGTVDAAGGKIVLAAGDIYAQAISNVGSLSASVETGKAGQVKLTADGGQITNTGTIEATGSEGGTVAMEGARIEQFGTVHADGTDSHGGSVGLLAEDAAALGSDSLTTANAGTNGDGGEIIVYSPDTVLFHNGATIEAKGGSESGDGGFVEVSGKKHVEIFGQADASSTNGAAGTFVIDPADITIAAAPEVEDIGDDGDGTFTSNADTNIILDTTIEGYLDSGTNVTLDTSDYDASGPHAGPGGGDITVSAAIDPSAGLDNGDVTLTLNAADDITVNAAIDGSGLGTNSKLNVELHANRVVANPTDDGNTSTGNVGIHDTIITNGGSFTSSGIDFDNTGGTISTNGGNVDIQNTGNVTICAAINSGSGDVDIDGGSSVARNIISAGGIIISSGTITLEASGNIGKEGATIDTVSMGTINACSTVAGDIYINNTGDVTFGNVSTAVSDIAINNSGDLSINSVTAGGDGDVILDSTGDITTQTMSTTNGDIYARSMADLILNGPVKSGGGITLLSTEGKIVSYDSGAGLTPLITDGGSVGLAAREIYNYSNNENAPLGIQGAIELFLFDTGPGSIELAEVGSSNIGSMSITVVNTGCGTIDITYDNERGRVDIDDNHFIKNVVQPSSFSYTAMNGDIKIGTITTATGDIFIKSSSGDLISNGLVTSGGGITLLSTEGKIETQQLNATSGNISATSQTNLILNGPATSGGGIALQSTHGKIETQQLDSTGGNIYAKSLIELILSSPVTSGGEIVLQSTYGKIETQQLDAISGNINARTLYGDLILSSPVTSGGVITLESTKGKIVFNDSGPGLTPAITAGGTVSLAAGEIYSYGNNEKAPLGIQGATELTLFDTGPGDIKLAEVDGSTIGSTSITVGDTGYGTIYITYDNERGRVDIDDNHFINSIDQPFSFSYSANKGDINIGSITTSTGDIFVQSISGDLLSNGPVTSGGGIELLSTGGKIVFNNSDPGLTPIITAGGTVHLAAGEIYSYGNNENSPLGIQGATELLIQDTGPGSIELAEVGGSTIESTSINVDDIGYGTIDITYDNERGRVDIDDNHFINSVDQPFSFSYTANKGDINIGSITTATGDITVKSIIGDLILYAPVRAEGGGVRLIAQEGKIYTPLPRGAKDTLNIPITGYCDDELGIGVDLPYGPGKAGIIIISNDDLKLGPDAVLTACGIYQAVVNDRQGVGFISTGKDPGIPIDVAIYVNSIGNVTVDSAVSIYPGGTMVIDTWDKVNDFGHDFKNSWTYNAGRNRLELVSRQILHEGEAVKLWTLPYAEEAIQGRAPPWFRGSAYGIQAYGIEPGSGRVQLGLGSISKYSGTVGLPSPVSFPFILVLEPPSGSLKMPDEEGLMRWLAQEGIAPYLEGAHPEMLYTDLRFYKAARLLRDYAAILNETSDAQIEELTEMLDGIVQPGPIALPIAWFDRQLRVNRKLDEALYAEMGGKWMDALIEFTKILNTQFGWPIDSCIKKVMRDYIVKLKADDHKYFVQKYILSVLGFEDRPIFLASLREVD